MNKFLTYIFVLLLSCITVYAESNYVSKDLNNAYELICDYKKTDTISIDEYLYSQKSDDDWKTLKINKKGDVIFKNKVILTNKGVPLNKHTAYTDTEFKILFVAEDAKPRKGCNPNDTLKNGVIGCYIDNPDEE